MSDPQPERWGGISWVKGGDGILSSKGEWNVVERTVSWQMAWEREGERMGEEILPVWSSMLKMNEFIYKFLNKL